MGFNWAELEEQVQACRLPALARVDQLWPIYQKLTEELNVARTAREKAERSYNYWLRKAERTGGDTPNAADERCVTAYDIFRTAEAEEERIEALWRSAQADYQGARFILGDLNKLQASEFTAARNQVDAERAALFTEPCPANKETDGYHRLGIGLISGGEFPNAEVIHCAYCRAAVAIHEQQAIFILLDWMMYQGQWFRGLPRVLPLARKLEELVES